MASRSDTELRTTTSYNSDGTVQDVTDPRGLVRRTEYDDAGRVTKVIENRADGTPGGGTGDEDDRVTVYTYTDGLRATMKADMPGSESDQTTTYTYGTTKGTGTDDPKLSTGHMLRTVTYPDSGSGTDVVTYSYNAQGQMTFMEDQAGTETVIRYGTMGRERHRSFDELGSAVDGAVRSAKPSTSDPRA